MENVIKNNLTIISKPHALSYTMEKTYAKFQNDRYRPVKGVALTRGTHCLYTEVKMTHNVEKWQKNVQQLYPNHMHILIPWGKHIQSFKTISIKLYEELRSQEVPTVYILRRENDLSSQKWQKNLTIISKPHAHFHTMKKSYAKFQYDRYKTVRGVALTRYPG